MSRTAAIVFILCSACLWGRAAWSQPNEPGWQTYTNPQSTLSWWTRTTNRWPWLRERLEVDYTFDKSIGVVIAISDYKDTSDFKDLASPARDAVRMKDFLINEAGFDKVYVLVDDDASSGNIRRLMDSEIPRTVGPDDRLLVYWSGHGGSAIDSSGRPYGFLALQEATEDGRIDSIHMDDTRRWLRRIQARHVLFVFDACYSGLTLQTFNAPESDPGWEHIAAPSEVLLTSSAANQESYGHSDGSGGLFTTAFLEGARGVADRDGDGIATVTEIALYAEERLRDGHLFSQTSQFGAMGRQEGRFFFPSGIEPQTVPPPDTRPVESTGGPCSAANADYQSLVRDSQQCGTVEAFLDRYAHVSECFSYDLATRRKNAVCVNEPAQPGSVPELVDEQSRTTQTDTLIADIESRLSDLKLTTPRDDNANDLLMELERLDPGNPYIAQARARIRAMYSTWIESRLQRGDIDQAKEYLPALSLVPGSDSEIERMSEIINRLSETTEQSNELIVPDSEIDRISGLINRLFGPIEQSDEFIVPDMVHIPAGTFMMGSDRGEDNEKPVHRVQVPAFEMARNELTWQEWQLCEADGGCSKVERPRFLKDIAGAEKPRHPALYMTVERVNEYLNWINEKTGLVYRLPSESEWEYAARAGTTGRYSWGYDIGENRANCDGCGSPWDRGSTAPVDSFNANAFGLNDMHGNVWERVADCWHSNYEGAPKDGSAWIDNCSGGVRNPLRGGSWLGRPEDLRAAYRVRSGTDVAYNFVGIRLARTLP